LSDTLFGDKMKKMTPEILVGFKNYKPKPHPMQHRIDEFRAIPSLYNRKQAEPIHHIELEAAEEAEPEDVEVDDEPVVEVEHELDDNRDVIMEKIYGNI
jgi:hypothetical protein